MFLEAFKRAVSVTVNATSCPHKLAIRWFQTYGVTYVMISFVNIIDIIKKSKPIIRPHVVFLKDLNFLIFKSTNSVNYFCWSKIYISFKIIPICKTFNVHLHFIMHCSLKDIPFIQLSKITNFVLLCKYFFWMSCNSATADQLSFR